MFDPKLETLAHDCRISAKAGTLPVDLEAICAHEEIRLVPLDNHQGFNGKIEFVGEENVFLIYHPSLSNHPAPNRVRFSIAHELGHFYIDDHRAALVKGITHESRPGFRSKEPKEIQADEFAASLLIPRNLMEPTIDRRGMLYLSEILDIAGKCSTSPYATTIRYVRMASEVCWVVLAKDGVIESSFSSDEARAKGLGRITATNLPSKSPGLQFKGPAPTYEPIEKEHDPALWVTPKWKVPNIWEHCISVGKGYTLSLLAMNEE
jgi:hypothetical protein